MSVYLFNPVHDPRWTDFIEAHPRASIFHTSGWLEALRRTYGYEPAVLTTSAPGATLTAGLPVCHVKTWFAGRLVSLPFSDHCEPLVEHFEELNQILSYVKDGRDARTWTSAELRPRDGVSADGRLGEFRPSQTYCLHRLNLSQTLDELFGSFHPSCVQRAIRRADREKVTYEAGSSPSLVSRFYRLMQMTRKRHGVPPQPSSWFRNLVDCLGERLTIRLALKDGEPISGLLTLTFRKTTTYKYGCSDAKYHKLGGMPFLFWKLIQEAKREGLEELDLGRTDSEQAGLMAFKDCLGASRSTLMYYSYPETSLRPSIDGWQRRLAGRVFAHLPDPALTVAGRLLYKHFG